MQIVRSIMTGALAGCAATAPMTATMLALYRVLPASQQYPLPPSTITSTVFEHELLEKPLDERKHVALTLLNHFLYGAASGGIYGLLAQRLPTPPALAGTGFGLAVWTLSYQGWLPALNVLPPATEQPKRRNLLMIAAHLVWGSVTGLLFKQLQKETA